MSGRSTLRAALAATALLSAAAQSARSAPEWSLAIQPLAVPAANGSALPQTTVSSRGLLLSWVEQHGPTATLRFAERTRSGWTTPRTAASGSDWFVNWADVPSVLRLSDGTLAAHWLEKSGPGTYAYGVRLTYSTDDGGSWSPPFTPHRDDTETEHGFASLFELPGRRLGLIWLDGRAMESGSSDASGTDHAGAMALRFTSFDRGWRQAREAVVDARVCECCPTAVTVTSEGPVAAFRNRSDAEVRDIHVSRLESGAWDEGQPVHRDNWRIAACPVNGPALSADGRHVAAAWFTAAGDHGRAFVAFSDDAGRTFGAPIRLDDDTSLGRVDVEVLPDGAAAATWIEFAGGLAELRARRVTELGERSPAVTIARIEGTRSSGYPRVARHGDELLFAWTETPAGRAGPPQLRTAAARLPSTAR
jgi:hypothetical protein